VGPCTVQSHYYNYTTTVLAGALAVYVYNWCQFSMNHELNKQHL